MCELCPVEMRGLVIIASYTQLILYKIVPKKCDIHIVFSSSKMNNILHKCMFILRERIYRFRFLELNCLIFLEKNELYSYIRKYFVLTLSLLVLLNKAII